MPRISKPLRQVAWPHRQPAFYRWCGQHASWPDIRISGRASHTVRSWAFPRGTSVTLEDAQAWQLSLNLGAAQPGAPGEGVIDGEDISEVRTDSVGGVQDGSILRNETMDRVFQECGNGGVFLALWIGFKGLRS